jgi:hypothetical protein
MVLLYARRRNGAILSIRCRALRHLPLFLHARGCPGGWKESKGSHFTDLEGSKIEYPLAPNLPLKRAEAQREDQEPAPEMAG